MMRRIWEAICRDYNRPSHEPSACGAVLIVLPMFLLLVLSVMHAGCSPDPEPVPEAVNPGDPWVVYHDSYSSTKYDREALAHVVMDRAGCGVSWGGGGDIEISLDIQPDDFPRPELVKIADEINASLPEGCPFEVVVETVEEAIQDCLKQIEREKWVIQQIKKKHSLEAQLEPR